MEEKEPGIRQSLELCRVLENCGKQLEDANIALEKCPRRGKGK